MVKNFEMVKIVLKCYIITIKFINTFLNLNPLITFMKHNIELFGIIVLMYNKN